MALNFHAPSPRGIGKHELRVFAEFWSLILRLFVFVSTLCFLPVVAGASCGIVLLWLFFCSRLLPAVCSSLPRRVIQRRAGQTRTIEYTMPVATSCQFYKFAVAGDENGIFEPTFSCDCWVRCDTGAIVVKGFSPWLVFRGSRRHFSRSFVKLSRACHSVALHRRRRQWKHTSTYIYIYIM